MGYQIHVPIIPDSSVDNGTLGKIVQKPDGVVVAVSQDFYRKLEERGIVTGLALLSYASTSPQSTLMMLGDNANEEVIARDLETMRRRLNGIIPDELLDGIFLFVEL